MITHDPARRDRADRAVFRIARGTGPVALARGQDPRPPPGLLAPTGTGPVASSASTAGGGGPCWTKLSDGSPSTAPPWWRSSRCSPSRSSRAGDGERGGGAEAAPRGLRASGGRRVCVPRRFTASRGAHSRRRRGTAGRTRRPAAGRSSRSRRRRCRGRRGRRPPRSRRGRGRSRSPGQGEEEPSHDRALPKVAAPAQNPRRPAPGPPSARAVPVIAQRGTTRGSPPGLPGGGIARGVPGAPGGGATMPGSTPPGGRITPVRGTAWPRAGRFPATAQPRGRGADVAGTPPRTGAPRRCRWSQRPRGDPSRDRGPAARRCRAHRR